jgi:hypothetical protein
MLAKIDQCEGCRMVSCAHMRADCPQLDAPPGAAVNERKPGHVRCAGTELECLLLSPWWGSGIIGMMREGMVVVRSCA